MTVQPWLSYAEVMADQLTAWRRDLHRHPELGYEEHRTSQIVATHLRQAGLETRTEVGRTGVVGLLRGEEPGPTILLRADMDALPIPDHKSVLYASEAKGKAHLCGHDAHTSMLMGTVKLLTGKMRPRRGAIKFMFQPAEEGLAGAKAMIDDGLLADPNVDAAIALHVMPTIPTGRVTVARGVGWAASDRLDIRILGRGGHAARPHETVDAVTVAAQVVTALQHIVSRQVNPLDPVVVTIGQINGGYARNVIAPEVELTGTIRTLNADLRARVPRMVIKLVKGIAEAFGAAAEVNVTFGYPPVINDEKMVDLVLEAGRSVLGADRIEEAFPMMAGEDFAFVAQRIPSVQFWLGTWGGNESTAYPLHHPMFDLDERALPIGSAMLSAAALRYLDQAE